MRLEDNQVLCSDYSHNGAMFAVGCRDATVRVYDEGTRSISAELSPGRGERLGHGNRVFSLKWVNENSLVSGGWDRNVLVWDVRVKSVVKSVYGPNVFGDSLDVSTGNLLTGSCDTENQLQLWSLADCSNVYSETLKAQGTSCMVYTAQFSKVDDGRMFAVGGGGNHQAYFYVTEGLRQFAVLHDMQKSVYSIDFANHSSRVCVAGADGRVRIYDILALSDG